MINSVSLKRKRTAFPVYGSAYVGVKVSGTVSIDMFGNLSAIGSRVSLNDFQNPNTRGDGFFHSPQLPKRAAYIVAAFLENGFIRQPERKGRTGRTTSSTNQEQQEPDRVAIAFRFSYFPPHRAEWQCQQTADIVHCVVRNWLWAFDHFHEGSYARTRPELICN